MTEPPAPTSIAQPPGIDDGDTSPLIPAIQLLQLRSSTSLHISLPTPSDQVETTTQPEARSASALHPRRQKYIGFLCFIRVLMKYLKLQELSVYYRAKKFLTLDFETRLERNLDFFSDASSYTTVRNTLKRIVGNQHWKEAKKIFKTYLKDRK